MIGDKENPSQQSRAPSDAERVEFTEAIFGNKYRKPVTAGDSPKEKMAPDLFIFSRPVAPKSSLRPGMNDQLISVLAPDQEILPFEPRLVIALNPQEEEKRVQTDVLLFTLCRDQPAFEARSYVYFFAGAYDLKRILPLVERNARRKAVELLHYYIEKRHSHSAAPLTRLRLTEASEDFQSWYSAALLGCPWNLRESFYDLRERIHSRNLIELLDQAFEQTIVCRIE